MGVIETRACVRVTFTYPSLCATPFQQAISYFHKAPLVVIDAKFSLTISELTVSHNKYQLNVALLGLLIHLCNF